MGKMVKPVLIEPMPVHELLVYTYNVVVGKTKAQDYTKSTPIGPRTTWTDFATDELFFVIGLFVLCHVWEVMGRAVARAGGLKRGKVDSFAASFLELGYYSLSLFCGYRVFKDTDWFWKSGWDKLMYDGRIQMTGPEMLPYAVSPDTKFVYLMEIAWYLGGFIRLVSRKAKKDFYEMLFHHVVTFTLMTWSYMIGNVRIGIVVYLLHNAFDPFLHLAKCCHYLKIPIIPDVSFASCAAIFAVSRLYYYPIAIWHAWTGVCPQTYKVCEGGIGGRSLSETSLIGLLSALVPIHLLWFYMILRVIKKSLLSSGVQGDVRSDSEDEEDEEEKKGK